MIVEVEELKDYMSSIGLTADQWEAAEQVLMGLERALERHLQRPLQRKERTELVFPDEAGRLWPKATPIASVSSPSGLYPNGANGLSGTYGYGYSGAVGYPGVNAGGVVLTYVGGLVGEDEEDVRTAILRAAAREMTSRHDDTLTPADLSTSTPPRDDRREHGWTDDELKQFDRLRRRTVV